MNRLLYISLVLFCSCQNIVEVDIPEEPIRQTLNGLQNSDSTFTIYLSESEHVLDKDEIFQSILGARIDLYEDSVLIGSFSEDALEGRYSLGHKPAVGKRYDVYSEADGLQSVFASMTMPDTVNIIGYDTTRQTISDFFDGESATLPGFVLDIDDPEEENNYYSIEGFVFGDLLVSLPNVDFDPIPLFEPIYMYSEDPSIIQDLQGYSSELVFSDEIFNGRVYGFNMLYIDPYENDEDAQFYIDKEDPDLIELLKTFGATPDDLVIRFGNRRVELSFSTISEDYYSYEVSSALQFFNEGNPFAQPTQVISNINNGYGIFAGKSAIRMTIYR